MLTVEEVRRAADLPRYREQWQDLLARSEGALLFQTCEWMTSWLEYYWRDRPLAFLFLRREGRLVGLAPLLEDEEGRFSCAGSIVLPADGDFAIRGDLLSAGDGAANLDTVFRYLRATRGSVRLTLMHLEEESPLLRGLPEVASRHRLRTFRREAWTSPRVRFHGDWEAYLRSRSSHLRTELRRKSRKLEAAGAAACVAATTPEQVERALDDMMAVDRHSYKQSAGSSLSFRPVEAGFLRALACRCAGAGWTRLYFLYLDSKPVAYVYGFAFRNEYYAFHTGFDEAYRALSPGTVLFGRVLRDCCERGMDAFDFLGGQERWKSQITTERRSHANVCVFSQDQIRCQLCKAYQGVVKPFVKSRLPFVVGARRWLLRLASR
ncbi:MAG: GNAT family N-acetyltransferase [Thermoanaerobaculia bacterium]